MNSALPEWPWRVMPFNDRWRDGEEVKGGSVGVVDAHLINQGKRTEHVCEANAVRAD